MDPNQNHKIKIGILTPPVANASIPPLSDLITILSNTSSPVYLITGNEGYHHFKMDQRLYVNGIQYNSERNVILRAIKYFYLQIRIGIIFCKLVKKCDIWIFFLGGELLLIPMVISKLFGKKAVLLFSGSSVRAQYFDKLVFFIKVLTRINCILSDRIILYSQSLVKEWQFESYSNKILIAHKNFINFNLFRSRTPLSQRPLAIGYIGRLNPEKGVQNFVQALPIILNERQDLRGLIAGDGRLKDFIKETLQQKNIISRVDIPGWISHDNLPEYLSQLRLLVIPSCTEGLPNIMLEAMACGTPVLAMPVGAVPDVISPGKTGFLLEDNAPEDIARNVSQALDFPDLMKISEASRRFVEENYSYEKTSVIWKKILDSL
jgi:glycosyltransferase involved in cell wall biosynthesis